MQNRQFQYYRLPDDSTLNPRAITLDVDDRGENSVLLNFETLPPGYSEYFPFDVYAAYRIRLTSFFNGAIYALNYDTTLSSEIKEERYAAIQKLAATTFARLNKFKEKTDGKPVEFGAELYHFYYKMLPKASGYKPKEIALGEALFVWQEIKRPKRSTRYSRSLGAESELLIEQVNLPRNATLTAAQKTELHSIHSPQKPLWFSSLAPFAQACLLTIVPLNLDGDWSNYEKGRPSVLRELPGEANASQHQLKVTHRSITGEEKILTESLGYRQGVPSSYEITDKAERQQSANQNLAQLLDYQELIPASKSRFQAAWGLTGEENIPCPLLFLGLVTPSEQAGFLSSAMDALGASGSENNTRFVREKEVAVSTYFNEHPDPALKVFNLNSSLNSHLGKPITPDEGFLQYLDNTLTQLDHLLSQQKIGANDEYLAIIAERQQRLDLLHSVFQQLQTLSSKEVKGRNRNFYLAGLYQLALRLLDGLSTGNCKSAKDRMGVTFMLADAFLIYCAEQRARGLKPELPTFDEQGENRERLVDIFCQHYASGHQLLAAHDNSPGAPGIKDEGVLDKDLIQKLQTMQKNKSLIVSHQHLSKKDTRGLYGQSRQVAEFNKPGTFWKKYGDRIQFYATLFSMALVTAVSITLMATGVFSPFAIIGLTAAAKLGAAATAVGVATNLAIGSAGAIATVGLSCAARDGIEARRDAENSFDAQENKLPEEARAEHSAAKGALYGNSTGRMPFLGSEPDYSNDPFSEEADNAFDDLSPLLDNRPQLLPNDQSAPRKSCHIL